jgi:hypothetical protein
MTTADSARQSTDTVMELEDRRDERTQRRRGRRGGGLVIVLVPVILGVMSGLSLAGDGGQLVTSAGPGDPTTTVAPTTTALPGTCRNSNAPACGPFRFQPEPGPDRPMTVQVAVEPASPSAGQEVVFRLTLSDPDGVSHGSSVFAFGDAGQSGSPFRPCDKFGAWEPPGRNAAAATQVEVVRHTYGAPGTYTATFAFEAGPFGCVDSQTGRGDRPYASSATGTVTVLVR